VFAFTDPESTCDAAGRDSSVPDALRESHNIADLTRLFGSEINEWRWGGHEIGFDTLGVRQFHRGPVSRPGDGTRSSTGGSNFRQSNGASWRMILDDGGISP
jgi:acyl-homoserine lactone acylase PvdQ